MNEEEEHIQRLIESKDFEQLNAGEQALVLAHLSEDEYQQQRAILLESEQLFKAESAMLSPDPEILSGLQSTLQSREHGPQAAWAALFQFRIPAYQAGLAMAALALLLWWQMPSPQIIEKERIVYQTQIDTVRVMKEVMVEVPVERVKTVERTVLVAGFDAPAVNSPSQGGLLPGNETVQLESVERSYGNSSLSQDDLEEFLVGL